jgi:hypothetical protein
MPTQLLVNPVNLSRGRNMKITLITCAPLFLLNLPGCGSEPGESTGTLSVLLESEDTITQGIAAGEGIGEIADGWQVRFDKFAVTVGDIDVHFATDDDEQAHDEKLFVVDLTSVPGSGWPLWTLEGLRAGRWEFGYATSGAAHGAKRHKSVTSEDFEQMVDADATYLLQGTITQAQGRSCPPPDLAQPGEQAPEGANQGGHACYPNPTLSFRLLPNAETVFGPCQVDGVPGVSIPSGGTQTVAATIHGDHLFFNGFPTGAESGTSRLAQWLADSDLNLDGEVTQEELESIPRSALAELDDRYQWSGAPIEVENMWQFVVAQLKTQGHMDGEGECAVDGEAAEHEHEHEDE